MLYAYLHNVYKITKAYVGLKVVRKQTDFGSSCNIAQSAGPLRCEMSFAPPPETTLVRLRMAAIGPGGARIGSRLRSQTHQRRAG
jgi:hypothetical protein